MRYTSVPLRPELEGAALVRELHVYGPLVGVGLKPQRYAEKNKNPL